MMKNTILEKKLIFSIYQILLSKNKIFRRKVHADLTLCFWYCILGLM